MRKQEIKAETKTPDLLKAGRKAEDGFFKTPTSYSNDLQKSVYRSKNSTIRRETNFQMSKSKSTLAIPEKCLNSKEIKRTNFGTPVSHLCSPSLSPKGRRQFTRQSSVLVKKFLSDCNLGPSSLGDNEDVPSPSAHSSQTQQEETSNFIVGVRVRPFNLRELGDSSVKNVVQMSKEEVIVTCDRGAIHSFAYDYCFWSFDKLHSQYASQETVFNTMVLPLIDQVFFGCNACLLAYGQTGSGKSYSMMGMDSGIPGQLGEESGVIPRFFLELFKRIATVEEEGGEALVEISYFEIYNEKIRDLLGTHAGSASKKNLKVREHPTFGPYVVDLSAHSVKSFADVQDWITVGNSQRITAATGMNEKSSRSHSIFSVAITQKVGKDCLKRYRSKVNLVDLAGSERVAQTCATGNKLKEGVCINKSLLSLGKVITFLAEKGRKKSTTSFGSYRESVLTWLLRESLGGNSKTAMLATISPANIHLDETLATLRYACQARSIVNRVYKNEDVNERVIRELRAEVEKITTLKQELERMKKMVECFDSREKEKEIEILKKQLLNSEQLLAKSQVTWAERLQEAESLKIAELQYLRRCGVAIGLRCDKKIPCLVNLAADPILTGTLLYLLPLGRLVVGRSLESDSMGKQPDIILTGLLIHPRHCEIENRDGRIFLMPFEGCDTYVNGRIVKEETEIFHEDRIVFGGIHYFRLSNPNQANVSEHKNLVDFDFAHKEILKVQEKRLREELEESKEKAVAKLEADMKSLLGAQKFDYERQIKEIMTLVEVQTNALAEERKQKHVLEMERNVLQERVNNQDNCTKNKNDGEKKARKFSPYKSTFLEDLKSILEEGGDHHAISEEGVDDDRAVVDAAMGLHEMEMMVREATETCRELRLNYEFRQQPILGTDGLIPAVKVVDKEKEAFVLWKPQKFVAFMNCLRDVDRQSDVLEMLADSSAHWQTDACDEKENRISVNTEYIKKRLSQNICQMKKGSTLTQEDKGDNNSEKIVSCLREIRNGADALQRFIGKDDSSLEWKTRMNDAMMHLEKFFSVLEGDDPSLSPKKSEKSVRFSQTS